MQSITDNDTSIKLIFFFGFLQLREDRAQIGINRVTNIGNENRVMKDIEIRRL